MRGIAGASRKGIQFKYYARLAERVNDTNLRLTGQLARALRCTQSGAAYGFRRCTSKVDVTRVGAASRRTLQHSTEDGAVRCRHSEASGNAPGQAGRHYSLQLTGHDVVACLLLAARNPFSPALRALQEAACRGLNVG
jgi:hypothetical protein